MVESGFPIAHLSLSADGPCVPAGPDIHLLPQTPKSHCRRLSLCSLPVPKQLERGLGSRLLRPGGQLQDLAACASNDPVFAFSLLGKVLRNCLACQRFGRHEVLLPALHRKHVGHQLSGHSECGSVGIAPLDFFLTDQGQFVRVSGRHFGSFHQHMLDMFVSLFGNGCSHHLVGRTLLGAAKSAVADRFLDRTET